MLFSAHGARPLNVWWTCHFVRHAVADLTLRWEELCFSFGHYWLYAYCLTTLGGSHCRQSTHRVLALDRNIHVSPFVSIWCRASWLSVSMAFECRADIHSVRASGCCRPDSPLGGGLLRFATVPDRCVRVYHVDRVRHQEEGTSLRDQSVLLIAWSAQALCPGSTGPHPQTPSCDLQLPQALGASPWVLSYHGKQDSPT